MNRLGRRLDDDAGFSLVELLVIVVIIGVLATIAITTYLAQSRKAERSAAISTLSNMRLAAESIRADSASEEFSRVPGRYETEQSSYQYVAGTSESTGSSVVSVGPVTPTEGPTVAFAVRGKDRCYYLRMDLSSDALFQSAADIDGSTVRCRASEYETGADTGWD